MLAPRPGETLVGKDGEASAGMISRDRLCPTGQASLQYRSLTLGDQLILPVIPLTA